MCETWGELGLFSHDGVFTYVIEGSFSFTLIINDMKRKHSSEKDFKSKKPSLISTHGPGSATLTTLITSTTDLIPSISTTGSDATTSALVTAGVSVSVQLRPSLL